MIRVTSLAGRALRYPARDVAGCLPLARGSLLRLRDGTGVEVREDADEIGRRIAAESAPPRALDAQNAAPGTPGGSGGKTCSAGAGEGEG